MTKHLRLIMLSLLAMICLGGYSQSDELYKTLSFPDGNQEHNKVGAYDKKWTAQIGTDTWTINNFNNNNWNWSSIKCGSQNFASTASIATDTDLGAAITKVVVEYGTVSNAKNIKACYLQVASDANFQNIIERKPTTQLTTKTTETVFIITEPAVGRYFKVVYELTKASKNGFVEIKNVKYFTKSDKTDSGIKFKEAAKEVELNTEMMSLSDLIDNPNKLPLTYSTSDKETAEELDGTLHLYKAGKVTVTASFAGDDTYAATSTSMELTIVDNRQDAGIHFAKDSYTADFAKSTFNGAELVKPEGLEVAYEITPKTEGVSIAKDGTVTYPAVEATYKVTATFNGDDTYKPATATYTLNVVDPNAVVFEADKDKGTTKGQEADEMSKNGVTIQSTSAALGNGSNYRFYGGSTNTFSVKRGFITKIVFEGNNTGDKYLLTYVGLQDKDNGVFNAENSKATWEGEAKSVVFKTTAQARATKITVTVKLPVAKDYTLDEEDINVIEDYDNANVTLTRTFYHDNAWNTLCLPFDVDANKVATAFAGAEIREIDPNKCTVNTIQFVPATEIKAGVPYIIKWNENVAEAKPFEETFEGVMLVAEPKPVTINNNDIKFTGFYNKTTADNLGESVAAIGAENKLFKVTSGEMKGFRAAFVLKSNTPASVIKLVIDGIATGIEDLVIDGVKANGRVYNQNGQFVGNSLNGLQPGLYIQNGKKIVVK